MLDSIFLILEWIMGITIGGILWLVGLPAYIFHSILSIITGETYYYDICEYAVMTLGLILVASILILVLQTFLYICESIKICLKTKTITKEKRTMILEEKIYVPSSTRLIPDGNNTMIPIVSPCEYKVRLKDINDYKTISDSFIYDNFKIGDSIDIILKVKKDKHDNVISENIIAYEY